MADDNGAFSAVESLLGDRYTREARLAPAFLSVFPDPSCAHHLVQGTAERHPRAAEPLCVFGVVRWISHIARGIGDKKEVKLFRDWGGKPTTTLMRVALGYMKIEDTQYGDHVRHLLWEAPPGNRIQEVIKKRNGQAPPTFDEDKHASDPSAKKAPPHAKKVAVDNPPAPIMSRSPPGKGMPRCSRSPTRLTISMSRRWPGCARTPAIACSWWRKKSPTVSSAISTLCGASPLLCTVVSILVEARTAHLSAHLTWPFIHIDSDMAVLILIALATYLLFLRSLSHENSVMVQGFIYARALLDSFYADEPSTKPPAKPAPAKEAS